jgi:hypothetical protein
VRGDCKQQKITNDLSRCLLNLSSDSAVIPFAKIGPPKRWSRHRVEKRSLPLVAGWMDRLSKDEACCFDAAGACFFSFFPAPQVLKIGIKPVESPACRPRQSCHMCLRAVPILGADPQGGSNRSALCGSSPLVTSSLLQRSCQSQ